MYGAILGDIIGSPFEFDRGDKTKEFELFTEGCDFTDDSVMTVAVAKALISAGPNADIDIIKELVVKEMQAWGKKYPYAGYGGRFYHWLKERNPKPYGSWGNGSAMRVSAVGWLYDSIERTREVARATAEVTHNHIEGIKGAEATAAVIFMARNHASKKQIKDYISSEFGYDLSKTLEDIRPDYHHVESCQETVPEAITAFLEGEDFEDVVRNAVSLGGDTDTLGAIAGAMAEAFYGIPAILIAECRARIDSGEMSAVIDEFDRILGRSQDEIEPALQGNEIIEASIRNALTREDQEGLLLVLQVLLARMSQQGGIIVPFVPTTPIEPEFDIEKAKIGDVFTMNQEIRAKMDTVKDGSGSIWIPLFTSSEEVRKGQTGNILVTKSIEEMLRMTVESNDVEGAVFNPFGEPFTMKKELIGAVLEHYDSEQK